MEDKSINSLTDITEEEFYELIKTLRVRVLGRREFDLEAKTCTLEILSGFVKSVEAKGARQSNITRKKMKTALTVLETMRDEVDFNDREREILNVVLLVTIEGIKKG